MNKKVLTANQLVEKAKLIASRDTVYKLGTYGNKKVNNKYLFDCSGLLKGILWGYPDHGKYRNNGVPDQNANTIIKNCYDVSSDFSNIIVGEIVWLTGHMGIYIGNGKVIEATPKWDNCVQVTTCGNVVSGSKKRYWTKHGKSPYIDYLEKPFNHWVMLLQSECNLQGYSNQIIDGIAGKNTLAGCLVLGKSSKGNITALLQIRLNELGYNCGKVDGINGIKTQSAIKAFQKDNGLIIDGIVGINTWSKLLL